MKVSSYVEEINDILEQREEKKLRVASKEEPKKPKKLTKKEQQIIDLAKTIQLPDNYHLVNTEEDFEKLIAFLSTYHTKYKEPYIFLDTEAYGVNPFKDQIISISIGFLDNNHYNIPLRPFKHPMSEDVPVLDFDYVVQRLKPFLENNYHLVLANAKYDIHILYNWCNIDITYNVYWDTVVAAGLLDENSPKGLKDWYVTYVLPDLVALGIIEDERSRPTFKFSETFEEIPFDEIPHNLATYYACHDTFMTKAVFEFQKRVFEDPVFNLGKVYKLFREIEMPIIPILVIAERKGVKIDVDFLQNKIGGTLKAKQEELKEQIYNYLGRTITVTKIKNRQKNGVKFKEYYQVEEELNLNSPKQLSEKLYDELKILTPAEEYDKSAGRKVLKKKTDRKTLVRNKSKHPVIPLLLEYRGLSKLIDAFCESLPEEVIDGRIHASYNSIGTVTGRMSCRSPNLQQIPSKFNVIRHAFHADEGRLLASIDFSQQELRWLAIYTQDPTLLDVYQRGLDMHSQMTCKIRGYNYDMFEQIRNYQAETEEETEENIRLIIEQWGNTKELKYAMDRYGLSEVNKETIKLLADYFELERKKMKNVVFGTVYGISEIGLSDQLETTIEEAKELLDSFRSSLPMYLQWERDVHNELLSRGFVEDWLGRKRRFHADLKEALSSDSYRRFGYHWKLSRCKRQAPNFKIQGSSASQVKKAMVDLHYPKRPDGSICLDRREWLEKGYQSVLEKYNAYILLQVHDELIYDVPADISMEALQEIASVMQNAIPTAKFGVTFKSDIEVAPYWGGKFSQEELQKFASGELDWRKVLIEEADNKIAKTLGEEYKIDMFAEVDKEEDDYEY